MDVLVRANAVISNCNRLAFEYDKVVALLRQFRDSTTLDLEKNPFQQDLIFGARELKTLIINYAAFSQQAVHYLLEAMIRNYDWPILQKEIAHNLEEENGLHTKRIPHLEMMRRGYRQDLLIETDNPRLLGSTKVFLTRMQQIFQHDDNAYQAGALLALEGTAIHEFHVLHKIVTFYVKLKFDSTLKEGFTKDYIEGHKLFEISHEAGLIQAIKHYIVGSNVSVFVKGYVAVCLAMHNWWEQMYYDLRSQLTTYVTPPFRVKEDTLTEEL